MICKNCGSEFTGNFCANCGAPAPRQVTCQSCGTQYMGNFCTNCGAEYTPPIGDRCQNLYDRNGNYIDIEKLAGVYLSVNELLRYFERNTEYSREEATQFAEYIYDYVDGTEYGYFESMAQKVKFEQSGKKITMSSIGPSLGNAAEAYSSSPIVVETCRPEIERPFKMSKSQLKRQAHNSGQACCPKCGSVSLSANKKGFSFVRGAIGGGIGAVVAPIGFVMGLGAGNIGSKKLYVTCLNCGHRWKM